MTDVHHYDFMFRNNEEKLLDEFVADLIANLTNFPVSDDDITNSNQSSPMDKVISANFGKIWEMAEEVRLVGASVRCLLECTSLGIPKWSQISQFVGRNPGACEKRIKMLKKEMRETNPLIMKQLFRQHLQMQQTNRVDAEPIFRARADIRLNQYRHYEQAILVGLLVNICLTHGSLFASARGANPRLWKQIHPQYETITRGLFDLGVTDRAVFRERSHTGLERQYRKLKSMVLKGQLNSLMPYFQLFLTLNGEIDLFRLGFSPVVPLNEGHLIVEAPHDLPEREIARLQNIIRQNI